MDNKKKIGGWLGGAVPFIANMEYKEPELKTKDIDENGMYRTKDIDRVNVEVKEAGELTPEAEQEIITEEEY